MTPETVNLRYVEISLAELASKVTVDDAQLQAYYEEQKARRRSATCSPSSDAWPYSASGPDPKDDAAVKAKAENILKRARAARISPSSPGVSQDPGSAQKGGDLGWAERKAYVAPFAEPPSA